jgi:multimeric flavodoxin WrbA
MRAEVEGCMILAIYGSPRRRGNTATLLDRAIAGAQENGAQVEKIVLRDLSIAPCLEIYGCKTTGRCVIQDDFQRVYDQLLECDGLMLASPMFFYSVSAHTKCLMDRCQSLWVKKYWIEKRSPKKTQLRRKGLFISAGATHGTRLFDGALLTVTYFFDVLDMELSGTLLCRGLDFEGDVLQHPEYLEAAYRTGRELAQAVMAPAGMNQTANSQPA